VTKEEMTEKDKEKQKDVKEMTKEEKDTKEKEMKREEKQNDRWNMASIKEEFLVDRKGHKVGTIVLRMRRETKLYGSLSVDVKEIEVDNSILSDVCWAKCAVKLVSQVRETPSTEAKRENGKSRFTWETCPSQFDINESNHVYDVFIMLMKDQGASSPSSSSSPTAAISSAIPSATSTLAAAISAPKDPKKEATKDEVSYPSLIGEARLSLYDARYGTQDPLPLFTNDHREIGLVRVKATLTKTQKEGKPKKATKEAIEPK